MADALVSIVVEKLSSVIETEVTLFAGARHELEKLKGTFQAIQAVLADVESRQVAERGVQLWLSRLKNVAYDIGDVVDEWERSNDGGDDYDDDDVGDGNRAVAAACFSSPYACLNHTVSRFKVAHRIKEFREKLDDINQDRLQFQFSQSIGSSSSSGSGDRRIVRSRTLTSSRIEEDMIGRGEDKETIISKLVSDSSSSSADPDGLQVHVIAIVGIGGLGKTTLAREIYNDGRVKNHFNEILWVCVSEPFDVMKISKGILEDLKEDSASLSQLNPLQNKLEGALQGKRFLLVLDDVWNEDEGRWSQLQASLTSGAPGSKILVTTRTQKVANTMSPAHIHDLKGLSDDHSWTLFSKRAFAGRKYVECSELESIGREISGKCKGVPLSLKAMGSAMNTKSSAADWQNILHSEMWSLPQVTDKVLPALLLSYYNLPPHLKQCFVYCSVYQKDAEIYKDELVKLWIVQGFVRLQGNREVEDIGAEYFDELVARSMFQEVEEDYIRGTRCKMHDLLHDLAELITEDETYIYTREKSNRCPNNVRHASLFLTQNNPCIPVASLQTKKLQTLFLDGVDKIDEALVDYLSQAKFLKALLFRRLDIKRLPKIIGRLKHLRYLDLHGSWTVELPNVIEKMEYLKYLNLSNSKLLELPNVIGKLKHLRYMDLSYTLIMELPESVTHLRNLQTLKLNDCSKLKRLPRGMGRMVSLRHLEIKGTDSLECLPKGLGRITSLRTLSKIIVGGEGGCGIHELQQLNSLQGDLVIQNLERVSSVEEARRAELCNKQYLRKLVLEMKKRDGETVMPERDAETERMDSVLEGLRPHANLEKLKLDCNGRSSKLPSWMEDSSFSNLTELEIGGFIQCEQNNLPGLGKLPALKCLEIRDVGFKKVAHESCYGNSGNDVVGGRRGAAFPKLEQLVLQDIELGDWELTLEAFLQLWDCSKLEGQPHHLADAPLTKLLIRRCHGIKGTGCFSIPLLEEFTLDDSSEFFSSGLPDLPNLKEVHIRQITKETLPDGGWETLVGLRNLKIEDCNELKSLPDGLKQLRSLENLRIQGCNKLESLPEGLGQLKKLQSLRIRGLEASTCLHDSLGQLESLENLQIQGCNKLESLPEGLGQLKKLKSLYIWGAEALTCLPNSLGQMQSLEDLHMDGLKKLQLLPEEGLGKLKKLKTLKIGGAETLTWLPNSLGELESLKYLNLEGLKKLESLPEGLGQLKKLKSLRIGDLEMVTCLPNWLGQLESLEDLEMNGWKKLESLPHWLGQLKKLESLTIENMEALISLPDSLRQLESLKHLHIRHCNKLKSLPRRLGQLESLTIYHLQALACLPDTLGQAKSLVDITIGGWKELESLPHWLGQLKQLKYLTVSDCEALRSLPHELQDLPLLRILRISGCPLLAERCKRERGVDWPKISRIPWIRIDGEWIQ